MLRSAPEGHAHLGLGRPASVADIDEFLAHLPAAANWAASRQESLAARTRAFEVERGASIVRQGEQTNMAYFVLRGRTVAIRSADGDGDRILDYHNPGDFFGEIAALANVPRTASVLAEQPSALLQVPATVLQEMTRDPALSGLLLEKMNERLTLLNLIEAPTAPRTPFGAAW